MKRDINLLPMKSGGPKNNTGMVVAIVVTFVYVLVFGLGILIPKSIKDASTLISNQLDIQIEQMQPKVTEYEELKVKLDILRASVESTGSLDFAKYKALDAFIIIENTCPTGVIITRITTSGETIVLDVVAADNYLLAQFALELERSEHFEEIFISGSAPDLILIDENNVEIEGSSTVRSTFTLGYDLSIVEEVQEGTEEEGDN